MARKADVAEVEWKLLHEIENSDSTTQRNLSQKLDLALGAVNFHLKRLVRKGYIKMKSLPPNRAIYFITPNGLKRKVRLTYEYMVGTLSFYREARQRSQALFAALAAEGIRKVAFLGARDLAEICSFSLAEAGLSLVGIYDDERAGSRFLGLEVQPEARLPECGADRIVFTKQEWATRGHYGKRDDVVFVF